MTTAQVLTIVFSFALVAGAVGIAAGIHTLRRSAAAVKWPKTIGKIVSAKVEKDWDMSSSDTAGGGIVTYTYWPRVSYEFFVNGVKYTGKRISITEYGKGSEAKAEEVLQNYPLGKEVEVSCNPAKPGDSVLDAGYSRGGYVFIFIGAFFILLGAVGFGAISVSR